MNAMWGSFSVKIEIVKWAALIALQFSEIKNMNELVNFYDHQIHRPTSAAGISKFMES